MSAVTLIGPMAPPAHPWFRVAYEGCLVPRLIVREVGPDRYEVEVDGRFVFEGYTLDEVRRLIPVVATAQAIAGGYPCHGAREVDHPYGVQVTTLDGTPLDARMGPRLVDPTEVP
jgi:hypothetical protein